MALIDPVIGYTHLWAELCAAMVDAKDCPVLTVNAERNEERDLDVTVFRFEGIDERLHVAVERASLKAWFNGEEVKAEPARAVTDYYEICLSNFYKADFVINSWPRARTWIRTWEQGFGIARPNLLTYDEINRRNIRTRRKT